MHQTPPPPFAHPSFAGRIGVARMDITPPVGIYARNWGAASHDVAESIHRPLTLTAMTLTSSRSDKPLILLEGDLGWWRPLDFFSDFQAHLLQAFDLDSSNLIFGLSHSHATAPLMKAQADLPGADLLGAWLKRLRQAAVDAIHKALNDSLEATLDWNTGRCGLATVRDLIDPTPDSNRVICGFNPAAVADDTLLVGRVTDRQGKVRATLVNYACHPTTLAWENTSISPDFVGAMRETMEAVTGAPALFMLGACGDLAPRYQYVGDPDVADRHGRELGFAALATLNNMEPPGIRLSYKGVIESGAPLALWRHEQRIISTALRTVQSSVELPLKAWPSTAELVQQRSACTDRTMKERLLRKYEIRRALGDGPTFRLPIYGWRMGEAALIGCCCEPYSVLQQELRSRFPERIILCMNLINGSIGYLPPEPLYDADVYQVWQTPFDRGSLEKTIHAMIETVQGLFGD